eukprot:TRINITY_DN8663_c1_g2_i1.p1 TRINITY_DN8663_c1_g2~~TRINITY_DN8663_c1_g2_i1.p1  ORF type:complete len:196 (+),score=20.68 TRINITY_DN8663_c1_g2_i1:53-589(+)
MSLRQRVNVDTDGSKDNSPEPSPYPLDTNPMTKWLHSYGFWALYISMIAMTRIFYWMAVSDPAIGWTLTCVTHAVMSYVLLHVLKGAPIGDITIRGKYDHLTFWEQIDGEYHGTKIRKLFSSVPVLLLAIAFNWVRNDWYLLPWVILSTAVCVIPKLPVMHRKRPFGDESPPLSPHSR